MSAAATATEQILAGPCMSGLDRGKINIDFHSSTKGSEKCLVTLFLIFIGASFWKLLEVDNKLTPYSI